MKGSLYRRVAGRWLVVLGCLVFGQVTCADDSDLEHLKRIDTPVAVNDTLLVDFGYQQTLRVPKIFLAIPNSVVSERPLKFDPVSFSFMFSTVAAAEKQEPLHAVFDQETHRQVIQGNTFAVTIKWLFYSAGNMGNLEPSLQPFRDARPHRLELNLNCTEVIDGYCNLQKKRLPSGIANMDMLISDKWFRKNLLGGAKIITDNFEKGAVYLDKVESPYEIRMKCTAYSGAGCEAYVFIKNNNFQYRVVFPSEAVKYSDDLIKVINQTIDQWVVR